MATDPIAQAARNLLISCAGAETGDTILILHEDPDLGWYGDDRRR